MDLRKYSNPLGTGLKLSDKHLEYIRIEEKLKLLNILGVQALSIIILGSKNCFSKNLEKLLFFGNDALLLSTKKLSSNFEITPN